jgi:hypothetical protein
MRPDAPMRPATLGAGTCSLRLRARVAITRKFSREPPTGLARRHSALNCALGPRQRMTADSRRPDRPRHCPLAGCSSPHHFARTAPPDATSRPPGPTPLTCLLLVTYLLLAELYCFLSAAAAVVRFRTPACPGLLAQDQVTADFTPSAAAGCPPAERAPQSPGTGDDRRASGLR